jgi:hypothetical protein
MESATRWSVSRRASGRALAMACALGLAMAIASAVLIRLLMAEPSWPIAGAWGLALGAFLVLSIAQGSAVRVESGESDHLIYALRGHDSVALPLSAIRGLCVVRTGALTGIGVIGDGAALEFRSRKGITRRHSDEWQQHLGVCLVLEHLTPTDGQALATVLRSCGVAVTLTP